MRGQGRALIALSAIVFASSAIADLRVIHASPDTPPVDVYVGSIFGRPPIAGLEFTQGTGYIPFATGTYDFFVTASGSLDPALSLTGVALDGATDYTVVAAGFLASLQALTFVDDNTINPDKARVRFIHASPDAPTVDIYASGADPLTNTPLFDAVSFTETGGYIEVDPGQIALDVRVDGSGDLALTTGTLNLQAGFVYTVFATGSLAAGSLGATVFTDAQIPAPGALALLAAAGVIGSRRRRA